MTETSRGMRVACLLGVLTAAIGNAQTPPPTAIPERAVIATTMPPQGRDSIGYKDPASALEALEKKTGVIVSVKDGGWTIAEDRAEMTIWSFPPATHPAYPAVIKRVFLWDKDTVRIDMKAICQANKLACDRLMAGFEAENKAMRESVAGKAKGKP